MVEAVTGTGLLAALAGIGALGLKLHIETRSKAGPARSRVPADLEREHKRLARAQDALRQFGGL